MSVIDWLATRTARERVLMAVLGLGLVPLAVILGLLWPLAERRAAAERALEEARMLNIWVAARADEAAGLAPAPTDAPQAFAPIGVSGLEQSLKEAALWPFVTRLEAESGGAIALDFEAVEFTALMRWLDTMHPYWGYSVAGFRMTPDAAPAMVRAALTLSEERPG